MNPVPSPRKPFVGGNWKMNLLLADAVELAAAVAAGAPDGDRVEVAIFPAFPYLARVGEVIAGSAVQLGAQDFFQHSQGAFTGEVSLSMLADVGVGVVLAGHSERRHLLGEPDVLINAKVRAALEAGLQVIFCVGELLEQREAGQTDNINAAQIQYGLAGVGADQMARVTIAYEPVWAIGTGRTATPGDAQKAHATIRTTLGAMFGREVAQETRIQYGGSVKPDNAADLFAQADIDGGLIGGASLQAADFLAIAAEAAG